MSLDLVEDASSSDLHIPLQSDPPPAPASDLAANWTALQAALLVSNLSRLPWQQGSEEADCNWG